MFKLSRKRIANADSAQLLMKTTQLYQQWVIVTEIVQANSSPLWNCVSFCIRYLIGVLQTASGSNNRLLVGDKYSSLIHDLTLKEIQRVRNRWFGQRSKRRSSMTPNRNLSSTSSLTDDFITLLRAWRPYLSFCFSVAWLQDHLTTDHNYVNKPGAKPVFSVIYYLLQ